MDESILRKLDFSALSTETAIEHIADHYRQLGSLSREEAEELITLFRSPPDASGSGLDEESARQFVGVTLQVIETCLWGIGRSAVSFVNPILQAELDRVCAERGEPPTVLETVRDEDRRGADRCFTFGQVKEHPADPEEPSFFCGLWMARRAETAHRVVFTIHAEVPPESIVIAPVPEDSPDRRTIDGRVRARGPLPWQLQVAEDSNLGRWITGLTGSSQVGQLSRHIPLGVLCDGVRVALTARGITHLLLGASRRDPPTRPWHTGAFLDPAGPPGEFVWQGHGIDRATDTLVAGRCTIIARTKIIELEQV